jgi:DNA-binding NarL/FixJ family response regulator
MSPQASWILQEEIVPRLRGAVPQTVLCVGAEDHQELIQDGIAMAARMLTRVEQQGKLAKISGSNISWYVVKHLRSGRRANGTSSVDVMASATQLNGSTRMHSLSEVVSQSECGDEIFELHDVISNDHEDPSVQATRKMDWDTFMAGLSTMEKLVVECLCNGTTLRAAGRSAGVCDSTMQHHRRKIGQKILEFMGANIVAESIQQPRWRDNLQADREKRAVRLEVRWGV